VRRSWSPAPIQCTERLARLQVEDFDYELPDELIAQHPLKLRDASRLMIVSPQTQTLSHQNFRDLPAYLTAGDVLVFNDSRVIPARLYGVKEETGARVELLLTQAVSEFEWWALAKPAKRLKPGTRIRFCLPGQAQAKSEAPVAVVTADGEEGLRGFRFEQIQSMDEFLQVYGSMPLPPYIHAPLTDRDRYQTVYAKESGSVAAPTAGLHFTDELMENIKAKGVHIVYVTLHVGLGTFRPVSVERVEDHVMHTESYYVPADVANTVNRAKAEGRRVIAVGTTALRTLESACADGKLVAGHGDTGIFIYPGYAFQVVDALVTNFHLPKSTLLMLVSALMGTEFARHAYQEAVRLRYRFFSFGDAMFITERGGA
jgi:S-adenosylmethionine:tRNA ribosyltransferase-isomerase